MNKMIMTLKNLNSIILIKTNRKKYICSNWKSMKMKREDYERSFICLKKKKFTTYKNLKEWEMKNFQSIVASTQKINLQYWKIGIWYWVSLVREGTLKSTKLMILKAAEKLPAKFTTSIIAGLIKSRIIILSMPLEKMKFIKT